MSSTADRWFVPDQQYAQSIRDYAIVHSSTAFVRRDIHEIDEPLACMVLDDDTFLSDDDDYTFLSEYQEAARALCYDFALPGKLVFADVDDQNPAHKEKVYREYAKEIPTVEEDEKTKEIKKELVKARVDAQNSLLQDDVMPQDERERSSLEMDMLRDLNMSICNGILEEYIVSRILTAKNVQDKEDILNVMSGQDNCHTKRPVLALLHMFNSYQSTEVGKTEGWAIGYDFIKELLVIKPFVSKGGNHPLGAKWHGDVVQDGVSFSGTPQEFVKAYIELGKSAKAGNENNGFKLLVRTIAALWIDTFKKTLERAYGAEFHADLVAVGEAIDNVELAMRDIKFRVVKKNKKQGLDMEPFRWMLQVIECEEFAIRDAAVSAKEQGEEKIAQNAAKLYERIHKQVKAFNENPTADLDL